MATLAERYWLELRPSAAARTDLEPLPRPRRRPRRQVRRQPPRRARA